MGFPIGYTEDLLPKVFIFTFCFLGFIRTIISTLLNFMGLSHFLETQESQPQENPTRIRRQPIPATQIRDFLPVIKFSRAAVEGGGDPPESCAVCLCEFVGDEEIRWLKNCNHIFHRSCLDRWMEHDQITCPLCRVQFVPRHLGVELDRRRRQVDSDHDFVQGS